MTLRQALCSGVVDQHNGIHKFVFCMLLFGYSLVFCFVFVLGITLFSWIEKSLVLVFSFCFVFLGFVCLFVLSLYLFQVLNSFMHFPLLFVFF